MPLAIIVAEGRIPAIIERKTAPELLKSVRALPLTPEDVTTLDTLESWLATLPAPSGYYKDREDAMLTAKAANCSLPASFKN